MLDPAFELAVCSAVVLPQEGVVYATLYKIHSRGQARTGWGPGISALGEVGKFRVMAELARV